MADDPRDPERPPSLSPYPVSRLGAPISLVDSAREIERADAFIQATASAQLEQIARQIRALQAEAQRVLERARADAALHRARCSFTRVVGKVYHLYERDTGGLFFSMLSPEDWGGAPPHRFVGSYRLEADQSWTPLEQTDEKDARHAALRGLLSGPAEE